MKKFNLTILFFFLLIVMGLRGWGTLKANGAPAPRYQADIRWTSYGIPHIKANDWGSVSFGFGYAYSKLNACGLADQLMMFRSERAKYYGPDKVPGSGDNLNVISDLFYKAMDMIPLAQKRYTALSEQSRTIIDGFIAGYNHYLATAGTARLPCASQPGASVWVRPATAPEYFADLIDFAWLAGHKALMTAIVAAQPPAASSASIPGLDNYAVAAYDSILKQDNRNGASNGWAIGRDRSVNRTGMLLGNPHYPWEGERRFFEFHLTLPGELNVYGSTLMGLSVPGIFFNENMAMTHTVCTSRHFTFYRLALKPGDPTTYIYDGQERKMTPRQVTIQVKTANGSLAPMTKTFYSSHFGPMVAIPGQLPWTNTSAWTIRNASDQDQTVDMRWVMAKAQNIDQLKAAIAKYQSINFVNTIAVDRTGTAFYADTGNVPNITKAMLDAGCALNSNPLYLDGSRSACEWAKDPNAAQDGLVPFKDAPQLTNTTYVANSNNSYWLTNPETPVTLTIPNYLWGTEKTDIGLRPRMGLTMLNELAGPGKAMTYEQLLDVIFNDRVMGGELLRDDLVALCDTDSGLKSAGVCSALAGWNNTYTLVSRGGHIFREFLKAYLAKYKPNDLWGIPFNPLSPVTTPNTLNTANNSAQILDALRTAVANLHSAGIGLNAAMGNIQFTRKGDNVVIPIHGGPTEDGAFNMLYYNAVSNGTMLTDVSLGGKPSASLKDQGGYLINYGSSYMQLVEFTAPNALRAKALISYSQSTDPKSPFFMDQTQLFSRSQWRDCLFTEKQIMEDQNLTIEKISSR